MKVSKPLVIILIIVVLLLLSAVGFGAYMLLSNNVMSNEQETITKDDASKKPAIYKAAINDMVLNVTNSRGREKLMKLSFTIKSADEMIEQVVNDNLEVIMDRVIALISARSTEELMTVGGKALLKEELREELNMSLNEITQDNDDLQKNMVRKILYTSFVIK